MEHFYSVILRMLITKAFTEGAGGFPEFSDNDQTSVDSTGCLNDLISLYY